MFFVSVAIPQDPGSICILYSMLTPTFSRFFKGKCVGKYTSFMDPSWECLFRSCFFEVFHVAPIDAWNVSGMGVVMTRCVQGWGPGSFE